MSGPLKYSLLAALLLLVAVVAAAVSLALAWQRAHGAGYLAGLGIVLALIAGDLHGMCSQHDSDTPHVRKAQR